MCDREGGMKRGRGRGRGGRGGKGQAIKNLERATADIQNMLKQMSVSSDQDPDGSMTEKRKPGSRGSRSMMDLSAGSSTQWSGPPNRGPRYPGPPNQDPYYPGPPNQGPNYPGPPNQGPNYPGPPNRGPYYPGPPNQGPNYAGPPNQGPNYAGPPNQGPYYPNQPNQDHYNRGPPNEGQYYRSAPNQGSYSRDQYDEGPSHYPPPPPSYEESVKQSQPSPMRKTSRGERKVPENIASKPVSAQQLVKALALFDGQMADTGTLSKQVESSVQDIEKVVKQRRDIFAHMKDGNKVVVELVPNIKLCSQYLSEIGCTSKDSCRALHLCKNYILAYCNKGPSCSYGHKFDTNHNASVLSKLYLDLIKIQQLVSVIRKVCRANAPPKICFFYNTDNGCKRMDGCSFLHICKDYVMNGGKCPNNDCSFNHQLTVKQCKNVLTQHGVSTNESVRDILVTLKSSLEKVPGDQSSTSSGGETKNQGARQDQADGDSSDSDASKGHSEKSVKKKAKQKLHEKTKDKSSKPDENTKGSSVIKSTDFYGDVEIPEICIYAVNDKCKNEKKGCKYLHAKSLFHWQMEKNKWYNFRIFQSKTLESAYRDVSKGGVKLPPIDVEKLSPPDKQIMELLGTHDWTADFKEMCIISPVNKKLNIRRVSTPSSAISSIPQATVYKWHFADEQGKWICYGHVDSLGKQDYVCNITSEDIEKQYVSDPSSTMIISNAHFKYKIDFKNMTQTNLTSMKVREIRRRPAHLAYQKAGSSSSSTTTTTSDASLPSHWQPMSPKQTHILVTLDANQAEYQDVAKSVKLMIPTARICEIRRLQNEYLWRLLQYKKADLSRRYDDFTMNVQKLFHGTNPDSIDSICKENIDGRRYDNIKEKYGKGTYFSNSCAVARTYCTPSSQGHYFLVMAEVIIGYVTVGSKGLNRPPQNTSTGYSYDTTVDNLTTPSIFVKYDKEEYYPEYILEITV